MSVLSKLQEEAAVREMTAAIVKERDGLRSRLAALEADNRALREALEPFARASRAIGDEPGPFRFESGTGYRLIEREDLCRAAALLAKTEGGA